jgi:ABC-type multidrug transport system fused ATPase/permease subunit
MVLGMNICGSFLRIAASVMILLLFETLAAYEFTRAYIYCGLLLVFWYFYLLLINTSLVGSYQLGIHIKVVLSLLLYAKVSGMTTYMVNATQTGTITNLVANDLEIIEMRLGDLTYSVNFPFLLTGMTALLYTRIGWTAFIGILIIFVQIVASNFINQWVANVVDKTNEFKDERVQLISELIEGNKYVKMYGWEAAFKKNITQIRNK